MATIQVRSEGTDKETVEGIKKKLAHHFEQHRSADLQLTSLFFQEHNDMSNKGFHSFNLLCLTFQFVVAPPDLPVEHLWGESYIYEELLGLRCAAYSFRLDRKLWTLMISQISDLADLLLSSKHSGSGGTLQLYLAAVRVWDGYVSTGYPYHQPNRNPI